MNRMTKKPGEDGAEASLSKTDVAAGSSSDIEDAAQLASIIEQNNALIKKGYEELARLDKILEALNEREASLKLRKLEAPQAVPTANAHRVAVAA